MGPRQRAVFLGFSIGTSNLDSARLRHSCKDEGL